MIIFDYMKWSNTFSWGPDNIIYFTSAQLTQLTGLNGNGKSSIALTMEEGLFNKNSKGIKKADILNRRSKDKFYYIEIGFHKDNSEYVVSTKRASTQTVTLLQNGEDISDHTATSTFKKLESILGFGHEIFSQIVYLSNLSSLEFLSTTDGERKKFLISLLTLDKYYKAQEVFKAVSKEVSEDLAGLKGKISVAESWIAKNIATAKLPKLDVVPVPSAPDTEVGLAATLRGRLATLEQDNKRITTNNKYKDLLDNVKLVDPPSYSGSLDTSSLSNTIAQHKKAIADAKAFITKMNSLGNKCATCLQEIDKDKVNDLITERTEIVRDSEASISFATTQLTELNRIKAELDASMSSKAKYEEYHALYNPEMESQLYDKTEIAKELSELEAKISSMQKQIAKATEDNNKAINHNTKIELINSQLAETQAELDKLQLGLADLVKLNNHLQILVKAFGPSGLVAYRIESDVKDLESEINKYLTELSDGRFQLTFQIQAADKLAVVITDNGDEISIGSLSNGERSRVSISALLGIRSMMQSLSNTRTNLLILDETLEHIDVGGKDRLVEILLKEQYLNTFVVSHGFSHPLLQKLVVNKENHISKLEQQ